jgi:hypothetical protein
MIFGMGSYLTGRAQRVRVGVGDYLSEMIYCHSGVPQRSHLGPLTLADINDVLDIFENVRVFAYADDLKLYMRISNTDDSIVVCFSRIWIFYRVGVVKRNMT